MLWLRAAVVVVAVGLTLYAFIDWFQTPPAQVRALRYAWWVVVILLLPVVGPMLWLWAGRPSSAPT